MTNEKQTKCQRDLCNGHYKFIEILDCGFELYRCNLCGDEQIPESM